MKNWSREFINAGFAKIKKHRQENPEAWRFWVIDEVIGFIQHGGAAGESCAPAGIYREVRPSRILEDHRTKHRRVAAGESALENLRGMFS